MGIITKTILTIIMIDLIAASLYVCVRVTRGLAPLLPAVVRSKIDGAG